MRRLIRWLRFGGWRNAYWREDAIAAECHHFYEPWVDDDGDEGWAYCVSCGALMTILDKTESSNTTATVTVRL